MNEPFPLHNFLRPDLQALREYKPGKTLQDLCKEAGISPEEIVKLDANENPYGPSPKVLEALRNFRGYHLYPDAQQVELRQALSSFLGVDREHILVGNGSDEIIDLTLRLFLDAGDVVVNCPPTFGVYAFGATLHRGQVVNIPRRADFSLDIAEIERRFRSGELAKAKMLILASPNNPDGSQTPPEEIERLLRLPVILLLDEAYVEFSGGSLVSWVPRYPNLIVTRTFSKAFGLAGLRVGYGVFPLPIIRRLWQIKAPFNVNGAGQAAALAALSDLPYMEERRERILAERQRLYEALKQISFLRPYPSQTNFILCRIEGRPAEEVRSGLERRGILTRRFAEPELGDFLRITVGLPEQSDALLAALRAIEGQP